MFADSALVVFTVEQLISRSLVVSVDQCTFLHNGWRSPGKLFSLDHTVLIERILASPGSISVTNCVFIDNAASWAGGAVAVSFIDLAPDSTTTPTTFTPFTLTNCTFEDNWSFAPGQQLSYSIAFSVAAVSACRTTMRCC